LAHGWLSPQHVTLTAYGSVKLSGYGEPAWLHNGSDPENPTKADLTALGNLIVQWSRLTPAVKRGKPRSLPDSLIHIVRRLGAAPVIGFNTQGQPEFESPNPIEECYASIDEMLEDWEQASADLPPNSEAWDRLVKYAAENATDPLPQRRTA
jgi:aminoglycoside phosphotransferase (APT) family kinase protein